jgi:outer membrane protein assembly factor BamD (BamD/ComL family)
MQEKYPTIEETKEREENLEPSEAVETPEAEEDVARRAILDMAKTFEDNEEIHQAIATYKDLIQKVPESPEAKEAKEGLLRIAQFYQKEGATHSALVLYKYIGNIINM